MILHRTVIQAKFGKADNIVQAFKQELQTLSDDQLATLQPRILTDISGSFDTVVIETTHESLATYEAFRKALFARNEANNNTEAMTGLIESGRNEYYTIEL